MFPHIFIIPDITAKPRLALWYFLGCKRRPFGEKPFVNFALAAPSKSTFLWQTSRQKTPLDSRRNSTSVFRNCLREEVCRQCLFPCVFACARACVRVCERDCFFSVRLSVRVSLSPSLSLSLSHVIHSFTQYSDTSVLPLPLVLNFGSCT